MCTMCYLRYRKLQALIMYHIVITLVKYQLTSGLLAMAAEPLLAVVPPGVPPEEAAAAIRLLLARLAVSWRWARSFLSASKK